MGHIAHLPEAVFNSFRSSTNLSDFAQIVEELISNSIDAGSTKVHISVDVGSGYIKVEDDGCGIKRDDLTLLGERHATSKLHTLAELNAGVNTLGFRGEALSSLSDVALLEVTTRARGSPNNYMKIIKGCKCLSLGLSRSNRGFGTTVIARDVFYNQPVRRRLFQSSPTKVLQSLRERVLQIALLRPQVEFKVIDVDREEAVFLNVPATSPLYILSSHFGIEVANNCHEIDFAKGKLRLSGFLSRSPNQLSSKAVQFFYINSRFVHKTPIHKLLNKFSTRINNNFSALDYDVDQIGEGNKKALKDTCERHPYPAYILNLCCPLSSYDITYEVSKTMVEFKDWENVILFINEVLQETWGQFSADSSQRASRCGLSHPKSETTPRKRKFWQHTDPTYHFPCKTETRKPLKNEPHMSPMEVCYKRKQREISEEPFSKISHEQRHQRIEQKTNGATQLSLYCPNDVPEITCNSIQRSLQHACGSKEENTPPRTNMLSLQSSKDEISGCLEIEWRNQVCGSDMENPDRKLMKFMTISDLLDEEGGQSSLYGNKNTGVLSKHIYGEKLMSTALTPVSSYDNLLCEEFSFEQDNRQQGNSNVAYWSKNLDSISDDEHSSSSHISSSFLSRSTHDRSSLTRKPGDLKWGDRDYSVYKEVDWPRRRECLQNDNLISEDIIPSINAYAIMPPESCTYSEVGFLKRNGGNHLIRHGCMRLDKETESFKDMCGQKTGDIETSFGDNSDKFHRDSRLYFEDGLNLHLSEVGSTVKELWGVSERQNRIHKSQSDAFTLNTRDFNDMDSQTDEFGVYQSSSRRCREMASGHYCDNDLELTYDMELESKTFCYGSPKAIKRRSLSAPPFYRPQRKIGLHTNPPSSLSTITKSSKDHYVCPKLPGPSFLQDDMADLPLTSHAEERFRDFRAELRSICRDVREMNHLETDMHKRNETVGGFEQSEPLHLLDNSNLLAENENSMYKRITNGEQPPPIPLSATESPGDLLVEWKQICTRQKSEDGILDVSSAALVNRRLVPESISKECFMKANVLQQLDRKYIPIVADGNLAVVDQHAADERIRLEQLRKEVLEGEERKKITLLEYEEELVLPVGGVQLLQSYCEQIEKWGWRYKIVSQSRGSFRRKAHWLHRSSCKAILTAVPCILGVNLTAENLSEYLEQLVQTDGSSAAPPAVLRILSLKACRGAIMFGDTLLQSECALLIDELKKTSLCFQCAHGRPTVVPLVNLEALHKQLTEFDKARQSFELDKSKYISGNASQHPNEWWHGLRKHRASLERAKSRLN